MESEVALALMRKAQLVFENDDTFLSFPLTALAFDPSDLGFMSGDLTGQLLAAMRDFSTEVDRIPRGPVSSLDPGDVLSKVYGDVLKTARLATSTRTPTEETAYQKALRVLYDKGAGGTRRDSAKLTAYKQCRDAFFRAQEAYANAESDARFSNDPKAKEHWEKVEKPELKAKLDDARSTWESTGHRDDVEAALQAERTLGAKSPALQWKEWRDHCDPDVDRLTDPVSNQTFWPSGFSPTNLVDGGGWSGFTLTGDTVAALAADAPADLRQRLADQASLEIDSLSFEFASVRVERSWFSPELFAAHFWKLPEGADPISVSGDAEKGRCPAYVAALVLARKLSVRLKQDSKKNDEVLKQLKAKSVLSLANFHLAAAPAAGHGGKPRLLVPAVRLMARPIALHPAGHPASGRAFAANTSSGNAPAHFVHASLFHPMPALRPIHIRTPAGSAHTESPALGKASAPAPRGAAHGSGVRIDPAKLRSIALLRNMTFRLPPGGHPAKPAKPTGAVGSHGAGKADGTGENHSTGKPGTSGEEDATQDTGAGNQLFVMAFVCKHVPTCPDPDPDLDWSE